MKVKLIKATNIRNASLDLTGKKDSFDTIINQIKKSDWDNPHDIPKTIAGARVIGQNRVIFNLMGNQYRMICHYFFKNQISQVVLYLCWIGSHEDYDKLCDPSTEPTQFTVWNYK